MTPYLHTRPVIAPSKIVITDMIPVKGNNDCFRFLSILLTKCIKLTRVCLSVRVVSSGTTDCISKEKKLALQSQ